MLQKSIICVACLVAASPSVYSDLIYGYIMIWYMGKVWYVKKAKQVNLKWEINWTQLFKTNDIIS